MFQSTSGSLHMSLTKVTFIKSVKVRRYGLCGCVAACYIKPMVVCVPCAVQSEFRSAQYRAHFHYAQHAAHTPPWASYNMLPHNRIVHNDVLLPI